MNQNRERELQNIIFSMINNNNLVFYGLFLTEISKYFNKRVPTACLAKHEHARVPVILFNPDFWDKLNEKQKKFLILHEVDLASLYSNV